MEYLPLIAVLFLKYYFKAPIDAIDYYLVIVIALTANASPLIVKRFRGKDGE